MKNKLFTIILLGLATWLALYIGGTVFPLLGTAISAILIGAVIRHTPLYRMLDGSIVGFISSYLLKTGIVLLGFTLSVRILNQVGLVVLLAMVAAIVASIFTSILVNKGVKANDKLSLLIGIGTSICGGSAIAASAPIIEAEDEDVAVAITTMFVYSMVWLLLLPILGKLFNFTDQIYGIVAGLAVNDTPSVVATSFSWSDEAGSIATIVKLVKTLFIVPITIGLVYIKLHNQRKNAGTNQAGKGAVDWNQIKKITPVFVVYFVIAFLIASIVPLPAAFTSFISKLSKLFFTIALVTIGLGVHVSQIKKAGLKPILIGACCSFAVITISIVLITTFYG